MLVAGLLVGMIPGIGTIVHAKISNSTPAGIPPDAVARHGDWIRWAKPLQPVASVARSTMAAGESAVVASSWHWMVCRGTGSASPPME
jgi:hypothetical protein